MSIAELAHKVIALVEANDAYAEPIVFVVGMAESIPILSAFAPSTILFIGIGAVHGAAGGSFVHIWIAGTLGASTGDGVSYLIGRLTEHRVMHVWPISRHPDWWTRAHAFFERWGLLGVLAGKFTGPLRPFIPIMAGISEMPFLYFLSASLVSSAAWAGVFLAPGGLGLKWLIE
ncbi:MAG: DedA family protein [Hyphomicrobiaceae bacterium]